MLVRTCVSTRPADCGVFGYEGERFSGCPLVCSYDGCNSGEPPAAAPPAVVYSSNVNHVSGQSYRGNAGSPASRQDVSEARSGSRSIISFGRLLISLLLMRGTDTATTRNGRWKRSE